MPEVTVPSERTCAETLRANLGSSREDWHEGSGQEILQDCRRGSETVCRHGGIQF